VPELVEGFEGGFGYLGETELERRGRHFPAIFRLEERTCYSCIICAHKFSNGSFRGIDFGAARARICGVGVGRGDFDGFARDHDSGEGGVAAVVAVFVE
jgi:hypothetical protein